MSVDFLELIKMCRAEALAGKLYPTAESQWRFFCRQYSQRFSTPLEQVLNLDPEHVILHVLETQTDDIDVEENIEQIMEKIYQIADPNYDAKVKKEQDDFDKKALEEEEERLRLNKPVHPSERNTLLPKAPQKEPEIQAPPAHLPKEGYLDLSYLGEEEQ
jgi:hypothetical protein